MRLVAFVPSLDLDRSRAFFEGLLDLVCTAADPYGLTFAAYDGLEQDEDLVWMAPDGTRVAWFHDPDGNLLSLSQAAP